MSVQTKSASRYFHGSKAPFPILALSIFLRQVLLPPPSTRQLSDRSQQILITGMGVDGGGENGFVSGEQLGDPDVSSPSVDIATTLNAETMKAEPPLEPGPFLPDSEGVSQLASGESISLPTDEHRRCPLEAFFLTLFPAIVFIQLGTDDIGQQDFLVSGVLAAAFEHLELHPAFGFSFDGEDVSQRSKRRSRVPCSPVPRARLYINVISISSPMLTADLQQKLLFQLRKRLGRLSDGVGIVHGSASFRVDFRPTRRRTTAGIASPSAI